MWQYKAAIYERNIQVEGHHGFTSTLPPNLVAEWEDICVAWENDPYLKRAPNPDEIVRICEYFIYLLMAHEFILFSDFMEVQIRKRLAEGEASQADGTSLVSHETSPSSFVILALELEDAQYVGSPL